MQTIRFLPDRLNSEPVVFRGFTTPEMGLAAPPVWAWVCSCLCHLFLLPAGSLSRPACYWRRYWLSVSVAGG